MHKIIFDELQTYIASNIQYYDQKKILVNAILVWKVTVAVSVQSAATTKLLVQFSNKQEARKKSQIEWISCNSCSKWVNPICYGLTSKEIQKIKNLSNKSKLDLFYKCLKCSLKAAKSAEITHKNLIEQDTSSTQTSTNNITKIDVSVDTQDLAKGGDTVKISLQSPGKVLETSKALSEVFYKIR